MHVLSVAYNPQLLHSEIVYNYSPDGATCLNLSTECTREVYKECTVECSNVQILTVNVYIVSHKRCTTKSVSDRFID